MKNSNPLFLVIAVGAVGYFFVSSKNKKVSTPKNKQKIPPPKIDFTYEEFIINPDNLPLNELPLIIGFHGLGSRGKNLIGLFQNFEQPAIFAFPNGPKPWKSSWYSWWELRSKTEKQHELSLDMKDVTVNYIKPIIMNLDHKYNPKKIIITGHSQGGMATLSAATMLPSYIDGAVAVSGWLPEELQNNFDKPVYIIHGSKDNVVYFDRTKNWIENLNDQNVTWIPIENAGHSVVNNENLYNAWINSIYDIM